MSEALVKIEALAMSFGGIRAIDGLSLDVLPGQTLGIVGPNGAGKSVLLNLITGFYRPTGGSIRFDGIELTRTPRHRISRLGIARTFQNIRLFQRMTVLENVLVADTEHVVAPYRSVIGPRTRGADRALELLELMGLSARADDPAAGLAYGDARRLEIARALAGRPRLLLLDEPAAGMNEAETAALVETVRIARSRLSAIVLIEHDMSLVRALADRVMLMDYGRKLTEGTTEAVFNDPVFAQTYLGLAPGHA